MKEKIQEALQSFVGESVNDITPEKVLQKVRDALQDQSFEAEIDISGNKISINGISVVLRWEF